MEPYRGPDSEARLAVLSEVAAEVGATPNQVVLAWLMHLQPTVVPLIGPRTLEQFRAALPADELTLSADQLARLAAAGAST
jgi:aryl-alcohol dehydrogenase-like predicted oxidoreductase